MKLTREELRDELWDAIMNRQDIGVSTVALADACLERMDEIGIEAVVSGLLAPNPSLASPQGEKVIEGNTG